MRHSAFDQDDLRALLPGYAVGSAAMETNLRVQLHLSEGCPKCAAEIEWLMEGFHAVPLGLTPAEVPAELRQRALESVAVLPQEMRETPILFPETDAQRLWKVLTALAAVAVVAVAVWGRGVIAERDGLEARINACIEYMPPRRKVGASGGRTALARSGSAAVRRGPRAWRASGGPRRRG